MSGANRIEGAGRLSRARTVNFTFDGQRLEGLEGDTLASAMLANGIHLAGRSFKYHRPRGIMAAGPEEPSALMQITRDSARTVPNVRASVQDLYDGLTAKSQNRFPSLTWDGGAVNDALSRFFPAGFYYKTFMWPRSAWEKIYEPIIRKAAGLGDAPTEPDPDHYANIYSYCDVLVIGGGAAGIAAALAAAKTGVSVVICDENPTFGGAMHHESSALIDGQTGYDWAQAAIAALKAMDNVTVYNRTTGYGYFAQNLVGLVQRVTEHLAEPDARLPRERQFQIRAGQVILATGAIERHMVFDGNDRPGVMLASAARQFLNHYGVAVGQNVGVFAACDSAYYAAFDLIKAGVNIPIIVDPRPAGGVVQELAHSHGIRVINEAAVTKTSGRLRVSSITVAPIMGGNEEHITVDALITSAGWTPSVHLYSQSRGKVVWNADQTRFLPGEYPQDCASVGACAGEDDLAASLSMATEAGLAAAKALGAKAASQEAPKAESQESWAGSHLGVVGDGGKGKAFVDFQNDVTAKDINLAVREGMHSIEHVKRFTTNGMATDQGKTSNMHGLSIAATALDREIPKVGLTTFRAPYTPTTFGAIVSHGRGKLFDPTRKTAMHQWHVDHDVVFENVGQWKRPWYYPQGAEDMHAAVNRECKTTRDNVGMFDASTLGKIEIVGPDAASFLEILYTNPWQKLGVGRCRYGIMLREDGFIYDDGVIGRLADDKFHVTTTTGGAANVLHHMEDYLQTEFPDMQVYLTSVSEQWAVIAVQGPKSREVLAPLVDGIDMSDEAFPHMSVREGTICGVPTRLFRMSFTGERGFEVNVPFEYGAAVWDAIHKNVVAEGGTTYGTEAMHVLRAEKGYIIVGQDTDGTVTPDDAGLNWAIGKKKTDFVGMRGMKRPDLVAEGRRQLVGLRTKDPKEVLEEGAQLVADPNQPVPMTMIGHVTSSYWSENCQRSIAMAIVEGGRDMIGQQRYVPMPNGVIEVEIEEPMFFDPEGGRLHG